MIWKYLNFFAVLVALPFTFIATVLIMSGAGFMILAAFIATLPQRCRE